MKSARKTQMQIKFRNQYDVLVQCLCICLKLNMLFKSVPVFVFVSFFETMDRSHIPYNCHFFYTDTIFVRIKFTPKNADFSR